jgi:hypothetical protein
MGRPLDAGQLALGLREASWRKVLQTGEAPSRIQPQVRVRLRRLRSPGAKKPQSRSRMVPVPSEEPQHMLM